MSRLLRLTFVVCGDERQTRTRARACGLQLGGMAGTIATDLVYGERRRVILPLALSVLLGVVWLLWRRASRQQ